MLSGTAALLYSRKDIIVYTRRQQAQVAALAALEGICEPNGRGIVISAGGALSLFRELLQSLFRR